MPLLINKYNFTECDGDLIGDTSQGTISADGQMIHEPSEPSFPASPPSYREIFRWLIVNARSTSYNIIGIITSLWTLSWWSVCYTSNAPILQLHFLTNTLTSTCISKKQENCIYIYLLNISKYVSRYFVFLSEKCSAFLRRLGRSLFRRLWAVAEPAPLPSPGHGGSQVSTTKASSAAVIEKPNASTAAALLRSTFPGWAAAATTVAAASSGRRRKAQRRRRGGGRSSLSIPRTRRYCARELRKRNKSENLVHNNDELLRDYKLTFTPLTDNNHDYDLDISSVILICRRDYQMLEMHIEFIQIKSWYFEQNVLGSFLMWTNETEIQMKIL